MLSVYIYIYYIDINFFIHIKSTCGDLNQHMHVLCTTVTLKELSSNRIVLPSHPPTSSAFQPGRPGPFFIAPGGHGSVALPFRPRGARSRPRDGVGSPKGQDGPPWARTVPDRANGWTCFLWTWPWTGRNSRFWAWQLGTDPKATLECCRQVPQ